MSFTTHFRRRARCLVGDRAGISLLEALISTTIIGMTMFYAAASMRGSITWIKENSTRESHRNWDSVLSRRVLEDILLRYTLINRCNTPFHAFFNSMSAGGVITWNPPIRVSLISNSNRIPASTSPITSTNYALYNASKTRCESANRTGQTRTDQYICLRFQAVVGAVHPVNDLLAMNPVYAEFKFHILDPAANNAALTCNAAYTAQGNRPLVAVLHYTMYWTDASMNPPAIRHATRVLFSPQGTSRP